MTPLLEQQLKSVPRDFGLLKTRGLRIKPAESNVIRAGYEAASNYSSKTNEQILEILDKNEISSVRELSRHFCLTNGIYSRAVRYLADMYRFDFLIYPDLDLEKELTEPVQKKILKRFNEILTFFDNSDIQLMMRKWAIEVCTNGAYYGYVCDDVADKIVVQDLPINYCRSRFSYRGLPIVEFNAKYFKDISSDPTVREQILSLFPDEFQKAWVKYQAGKLQRETFSDDDGWFVLSVKNAFKISFNDSDYPPLVNAIPALISLAETQDLAKEELLQKLQKILVQHFSLDSNGQLPFSMVELQQLNQNAVDMIESTVGVAVLSTVADVDLHDISENGKETSDSVEAAENSVYNDLGIAMNLFNTEGSAALEKSVAVDEGFVKPLLLQFEAFLNRYISDKFNQGNFKFRLKMLQTTIFNYKDLATSYQNLTKIGFSRFFPAVCLGHTQKEVISVAKLEQQLLNLDAFMIPPFSSNSMSSDSWAEIKAAQENANKTGQVSTASINTEDLGVSEGPGRPPLAEGEKSDKTLANLEAIG